MRIPFPQSLSIGTDIVHLPRLFKSRTNFAKLAARILLPRELEELDARFPGWAHQVPFADNQINRVRDWLGGRFAAKEAAKKAWGAQLVGFHDLGIIGERGKPPYIICTPFAGHSTLTGPFKMPVQAAKLSIAHDGEYATATVLASPLHKSILAELGLRKAEAEKKVKTPSDINKRDEKLEESQQSEIDVTNERNTSTVHVRRIEC